MASSWCTLLQWAHIVAVVENVSVHDCELQATLRTVGERRGEAVGEVAMETIDAGSSTTVSAWVETMESLVAVLVMDGIEGGGGW